MRKGLVGFADDCQLQRQYLGTRVPAYGAILELVVSELPALSHVLSAAWSERSFFAWYDRPLLLLASLRFDALTDGPAHPLHGAVVDGRMDGVTREALLAACSSERMLFTHALRSRAVQTNESSRAVAWMLVAAAIAERFPNAKLALYDLAASGGLNLIADRLPRPWTTEDGRTLALSPLPEIVSRLGYDLSPIDVSELDGARWLEACVWPREHVRLNRLSQAIAAFTGLRAETQSASERGPVVHAARAAEMPARVREHCARLPSDTFVIAYQTVMRDYLPEDESRVYGEGMLALVQERPRTFWVELEMVKTPDPAHAMAITLHTRVAGTDRELGPRELEIARCGPHPLLIALRDDVLAQALA
jgi:hypothetical protein